MYLYSVEMIHLYYFSPFDFRFRSGATIQETRNFSFLAPLGYRVYFYGTSRDAASLSEVKQFIGDAAVEVHALRMGKRWSPLLDVQYLMRIARDQSRERIVIGRHVKRTNILLKLRGLLGNPVILHELHERAFPHLLTEKANERAALRKLTEQVLAGIDGLFLTNYSQEIVLKQEFPTPPPYGIFPHAVEHEKFARARSNLNLEGDNPAEVPYVVTFVGHFAVWRNFELLFQVLAALPTQFRLRIAGGISSQTEDSQSKIYLDNLSRKYGLEGRVTYLGHVSPARLVPEVLDKSSVLVMPMGNNLSARYFTCPIKLMEYMSTQIPVVAVDYPSVNLITGRDTVFLANDSVESFERAVKAAVTAADRWERIQRMNAIARKGSFEARSKRVDIWYRERLEAHTALHTAAREPA